jgi:hypothetical protein
MTLRKLLTRMLLAALNSRYLNSTPCRYAFIGNVDAFDLEHLRSEARSRPELTLRGFIAQVERFARTPLDPVLAVIPSNGSVRAVNEWDCHDLRLTMRDPKRQDGQR